MAERLTSKNTVSVYNNSNSEIYLSKGEEATKYIYKLAQLEDIMEKYGIESVEELEKILGWLYTLSGEDTELMKFITQERKQIHDMYCEIKKDRDTWHKACELACEREDDCYVYDNIHRAYEFYQQAKTEGNDE